MQTNQMKPFSPSSQETHYIGNSTGFVTYIRGNPMPTLIFPNTHVHPYSTPHKICLKSANIFDPSHYARRPSFHNLTTRIFASSWSHFPYHPQLIPKRSLLYTYNGFHYQIAWTDWMIYRIHLQSVRDDRKLLLFLKPHSGACHKNVHRIAGKSTD